MSTTQNVSAHSLAPQPHPPFLASFRHQPHQYQERRGNTHSHRPQIRFPLSPSSTLFSTTFLHGLCGYSIAVPQNEMPLLRFSHEHPKYLIVSREHMCEFFLRPRAYAVVILGVTLSRDAVLRGGLWVLACSICGGRLGERVDVGGLLWLGLLFGVLIGLEEQTFSTQGSR